MAAEEAMGKRQVPEGAGEELPVGVGVRGLAQQPWELLVGSVLWWRS